MAEIGRRGFATLVNRYFAGDRQSAIDWLHAHACESELMRAADTKLANGETCVEYPMILDIDNDPFYDDPVPTWESRVSTGRNGRVR